MSNEGLAQAQQKMSDAGVGAAAIEVFSAGYRQLAAGQTGIVEESSIEPLVDIAHLDQIEVDPQAGRDALAATVFIKLNGGLGTSMGLAGPKVLLPVRDGRNFLDLLVRQVLAARAEHQVKLPLVLMHSFATRDDSLAVLDDYPELPVDGLPLDFVQSQEPKLLADSLAPVDWPANPALEWCPPGHGDIYPSLLDSGVLDQLIEAGYRYAAVSNADNLGATPDATLAGWFADSGAAFAMEVCRRTVNDRKGGHLAVRSSDGHIVLRESAQTADADRKHFADENRHPWFNTNNLWLDLAKVRAALVERDGVLGLPMIRNVKTVDPTDAGSPKVVQIETAMGAAIEVFDEVAVIEVGRDRFVPVKKTNELLLLRSDCYTVDDQTGRLHQTVEVLPAIDLDGDYYGHITDFDARIPDAPSLVDAQALRVRGDITFGSGVRIVGDADLVAEEPEIVPDGSVVGE